ncbi:MAG: esterase [Gammaproteobacteria bacterium RIFCSPHIGHO2_12_FULL_41_20]|nr:MAG: esterase [Gammaproteobacteria bacterium RIFCSPHIGHO2_12_FULL_41_20]
MKIWKTDVTLAKLTERGRNTIVEHLGIEFTELGDDYLQARMPVDQRTKQPLGIMHGGASCVLAETIGSMAANYCVNTEEHYCVGLDINTNHIRPARQGYVTGVAKPYHIGKSTQVWGIEIVDDAGKLVSITRLTMAVLNHPHR